MADSLSTQKISHVHNAPSLWRETLRQPDENDHKYTRGHVCVCGGDISVGAAKLVAMAALRSGAGLATILCSAQAFPIYASWAQSVMVKPYERLPDILPKIRCNAIAIGPGLGMDVQSKQHVIDAIKHAPSVIDADALSLFADDPDRLFSAIKTSEHPVILTPHEGEFARLFTMIDPALPRAEKALKAAELSGAVLILKGHHTLIASPDGALALNDNAPPWLATAGAGDVLSGICAAMLGHNMPAFDAACAAVWFHAEAASIIGAGLIAEDLPPMLPSVIYGLMFED